MSATGSGVGGWAVDHLAGGIPVMLGWMGGLIFIPAALWLAWISFGKLTPAEYVHQEMPTALIPKQDVSPTQSAGE
jgi:hypothetical protein